MPSCVLFALSVVVCADIDLLVEDWDNPPAANPTVLPEADLFEDRPVAKPPKPQRNAAENWDADSWGDDWAKGKGPKKELKAPPADDDDDWGGGWDDKKGGAKKSGKADSGGEDWGWDDDKGGSSFHSSTSLNSKTSITAKKGMSLGNSLSSSKSSSPATSKSIALGHRLFIATISRYLLIRDHVCA